MAMTVSDIANFCGERIDIANADMREALEEGDGIQVARSLHTRFDSQFLRMLIYWRQGTDPTQELRSTVKGVFEGRAVLKRMEPEVDADTRLSPDCTIYLAFLADLPHPPVDLTPLNKHQTPEAFLGNVVIGAADIADWPQYANQLSDTKRHALARETSQLYADLLSGGVPAEEGVKRGEKLFSRRRGDAYYTGGSRSEGGTDYNDMVVDYRLAAILKKIGSKVPTIHAWKW